MEGCTALEVSELIVLAVELYFARPVKPDICICLLHRPLARKFNFLRRMNVGFDDLTLVRMIPSEDMIILRDNQQVFLFKPNLQCKEDIRKDGLETFC